MDSRPQITEPINLDAEQALLGCLLLNPRAYHAVSEFLEPTHFGEEVHQRLFEAIGTLIRDDRSVAPVMLRGFFAADQKVGDCSIVQYLARLAAETHTQSVDGALGTARAVHDWAMRRGLFAVAGDMAAMATDASFRMTAADQIADAEQRLVGLSEDAARASPEATKRAADYDTVLADIEDRRRTGRHLRGVSTGLAGLDERLGGLAPGQFVIIAGRPSIGKTLVGCSLARKIAMAGGGAAYDSIEQPEEQIRLRMLSDETFTEGRGVPYSLAGKGRLDDGQVAALRRAGERLKQAPLVIIDRGNRLADIPGHIRLARRSLERHNKPLSVFVVDYLGLLFPGDRYRGQKTNEVGEISSTLKALAKRENVCLIALHQLNRANESRGDRRPVLSDLRDSGNLEQDADVVMFVHREAYYLERAGYADVSDPDRLAKLVDCRHALEMIVAKQRQGPIGIEHLWCDPALNAVRDRAR